MYIVYKYELLHSFANELCHQKLSKYKTEDYCSPYRSTFFSQKNYLGLLRTRKTIENVITVLTFKQIWGERGFSVPPMFSNLASRRRPVFEIPPSTLTPFTRYPCPENDNQFLISIPKISLRTVFGGHCITYRDISC